MKVAVVTGAAGAIGAAICTRLTGLGYRVVALDLDAAGLSLLPPPVVRLACDITAASAGDEVVAALAEHGRCDLLVHAAGVVVTTPFEDATPEQIIREQAVNVQAPILLTHALFGLLRRSSGHVVGVVSLGSQVPLAESPGYSASKAGLRGFLLALAMSTRETGVEVSIVNPGAVDTPMLRHEAATGGSALNFLGDPLTAGAVAGAVTARVVRPRIETAVPWYAGWFGKTVALAPGLLRRYRPVLERAALPALRRYRRKHGIG